MRGGGDSSRKRKQWSPAEPSGQSRSLGFPQTWRHQRAPPPNDSPGQATLWRQEVLECKEPRDVSPPEELLFSIFFVEKRKKCIVHHARIRVRINQIHFFLFARVPQRQLVSLRGNQRGCVEDENKTKQKKKPQAALSQNMAVKRTNGKWIDWRVKIRIKKNQGKVS